MRINIKASVFIIVLIVLISTVAVIPAFAETDLTETENVPEAGGEDTAGSVESGENEAETEEEKGLKEMLTSKLTELEALISGFKDKIENGVEGGEEDGETAAWQIYLEEKLLPAAMSVLTTLFTLLIAITPLIIKIKNVIANWKGVSDDVTTATGTVKENEARIAKLEAGLNAVDSTLEKYTKLIKDTNDIARIGFCNLDELVKNGYAREIAKIGEGEEAQENADGEAVQSNETEN